MADVAPGLKSAIKDRYNDGALALQGMRRIETKAGKYAQTALVGCQWHDGNRSHRSRGGKGLAGGGSLQFRSSGVDFSLLDRAVGG